MILGNHFDVRAVTVDDIRIVVTLGHHRDIMAVVTLRPWAVVTLRSW